jgi:hypothetical protein
VEDDQILTAVALTLATKAAEGLAEGGRAAFAALARLVRRQLDGRPSGTVALVEAQAHPTDPDRIRTLRDELALAGAEDPTFREEMQALWRDLSPHLIANADSVINTVSGEVAGHVVQARDIHGGISFGQSEPPSR